MTDTDTTDEQGETELSEARLPNGMTVETGDRFAVVETWKPDSPFNFPERGDVITLSRITVEASRGVAVTFKRDQDKNLSTPISGFVGELDAGKILKVELADGVDVGTDGETGA